MPNSQMARTNGGSELYGMEETIMGAVLCLEEGLGSARAKPLARREAPKYLFVY